MEQIEFRAWNEHEGMSYSCDDYLIIPPFWKSSDYSILFRNKKGNHYPIGYSGVLMQYIGLKDKKKKKVFVDDLLQYEYCTIGGNKIGVLRLCKGRYIGNYYFEHISGDDYRASSPRWHMCYFREGEVIGNIYENKELLKGEENVI